jgi:hypothetical protein
MASVRRRGKRVRLTLDSDEVRLLHEFVSQVSELLADGEPEPDLSAAPETETEMLEQWLEQPSGPMQTPRDPVLLRLLPDGYRNDDDAAGEFRRLTESGLRATKRAALQRIIDDLSALAPTEPEGEIRLDLDETAAESWLPALTDVRLAFGTRIGVAEDVYDEVPDPDEDVERYAELAAYDWLSWLQQSIVNALLGD